ncbi:hypothetical protein [Streptomyces albipurpureus]|uniref:Uncharacterized protein n=1 Tax=Streptomyces albipurpureus TaxID=2897419 RepID=A0ABT0UI37_9ACTN|nr:hypothetical protein [Streptomyces sp. CWNU-1]MCM2388128.1 hypothetical protein [Streptomyces sp. CWNU-1]
MTTRSPDPRIEALAARLRKDLQERADIYGPPPLWEPIWKRPRKPKSRAAKKAELRRQRKRLRNAGQRRFAAGQSRRPRSRQNRIGNAAARRDARALSRVRHSNAWLW